MSYAKILITLDGTPLSEHALEEVLQMATPQAQIHLLSVARDESGVESIAALANAVGPITTFPYDTIPLYQPDPLEVKLRERYLREMASWLENLGYTVTTEVRSGDVIHQILEVAHHFDVVIMATHARTGLQKLAFGSVAESVLHESSCP